MLVVRLGLTGLLVASLSAAACADEAGATDSIIRRWQDMRFGMFIHWGPVSLKGTEIGWSREGPRRGRADRRDRIDPHGRIRQPLQEVQSAKVRCGRVGADCQRCRA